MDTFRFQLVLILQIFVIGIQVNLIFAELSTKSESKPCSCGAFPSTIDLSRRQFKSNYLRNLTYDNSTKCLKINHDNFKTLDCMDLSTLPVNLTNICMKDNALEEITCKNGPIFKHLSHLLLLDVRDNAFSLNGFKTLFDSVHNSSIKKLFLSNNSLDVTDVKSLNFSFVSRLTHLHVKNCKIKVLASLFADAGAFQFLKYLDVSYNMITEMSMKLFDITKFPSLRVLILSHNPIAYISMEEISHLSLEKLYINSLPLNTSASTFKGISSVSLRTLNISSSFVFNPAFKDVYNDTLGLEVLHMDNISLDMWSDIDLQKLFSPLVRLENLTLSRSNISHISKTMFQSLGNLRLLDLSHNNITGWNTSCFSNVSKHLRKLDLSHNKVATVNDTSFPEDFVKQLRKLKLHGNNFRCDCSIHWFRTWMRGHYGMLDALKNDNSSRYLCKSPDALHNTVLVDFDPTYEDCHGLSTAESVATVITAVSFIFIILTCKMRNVDENEIY